MFDKKKIVWIIISALLAIMTVAAVMSQAGSISVEDLTADLRSADRGWLALAVCAMMGFIVFEGEAIRSILRQVGYRRSIPQGFLYAAGDVYFSAITPSASGGQPASAYFMMKSEIPGPVVTAVLILNLVMYTLGIITVGLVCIATAPQIFMNFHLVSRIFIVAGYVMIMFLAIVFILLLMRQQILENICTGCIRFLHRIRLVRDPDIIISGLHVKMAEYADCVDRMKGHKGAFVSAYLWNLAQRISQIMVSVCMYMAIGGSPDKAYDIWVTQSMVAIGSNCVPIPGGMGVTDYLMIDGFGGMLGRSSAFRLELLSRSLSFYVCIIVSAVAVLAGYIFIKNREKRKML